MSSPRSRCDSTLGYVDKRVAKMLDAPSLSAATSRSLAGQPSRGSFGQAQPAGGALIHGRWFLTGTAHGLGGDGRYAHCNDHNASAARVISSLGGFGSRGDAQPVEVDSVDTAAIQRWRFLAESLVREGHVQASRLVATIWRGGKQVPRRAQSRDITGSITRRWAGP